jgi:DNA-binding transcriptional LysR family regulator
VTHRARSAWQGIEVRHLAALQALAEEASFQRAGRRLGYSQPAVSQQLATLERIVGAQLVNRPRVSQPLTLTEAGKRLLVHAKAIQANLAIAEAELVGVGEATQLRIGAYQTIAAHLLPHVLREFARETPHIEVVLTDNPGDERLVALLEEGDLDLAFVDLPLRLHRALETESLAIDEYVLVVPHNSPVALRGEPVRVADLADLKLIGFNHSGSTQRVITHLRSQGVEPQFALRSDDNTVVQGFLAAGFGAALIPRLAADLLGGQVAVLRFEAPLPPRVIGLAWIRELAACPSAALFLATTRRVVARLWSDRVIAGESLTTQRRTAQDVIAISKRAINNTQ